MENLKNIRVTGEISVQPWESFDYTHGIPYVVLIFGPTGAGKSSFVEALAGPSQKLSLSCNGLAGYTQNINAFRVINAKVWEGPIWEGPIWEGSIYLVDTPGFSDNKFSEKEILDMANAWLHQEGLHTVRILYFVPINGTRLPGTQRKTLEMLKSFLKSSGKKILTHLMLVTTMWDTLHSEGALSRGQSNFEQLRDKHLKHFINAGATIVKFSNTSSSAIQILDSCIATGEYTYFTNLKFRTPQLYRDLYERIENALLEKKNIEDDLAQPEAQTNINLRNILERNWRENGEILTKFIMQFDDYGDAPEGFEDAAHRLRQEIDIATNCPQRIRSILPKDSTEPDVNTPLQLSFIHVENQISQTLPSVDALNPLVVKSEPGQPERTLIPIIIPERSLPTQAICPKASTKLDVITQGHLSSIHLGNQTFPPAEATDTPVLELEGSQPGLTSTTIIPLAHRASFREMLREFRGRILEGATRPWKKRFGPKH